MPVRLARSGRAAYALVLERRHTTRSRACRAKNIVIGGNNGELRHDQPRRSSCRRCGCRTASRRPLTTLGYNPYIRPFPAIARRNQAVCCKGGCATSTTSTRVRERSCKQTYHRRVAALAVRVHDLVRPRPTAPSTSSSRATTQAQLGDGRVQARQLTLLRRRTRLVQPPRRSSDHPGAQDSDNRAHDVEHGAQACVLRLRTCALSDDRLSAAGKAGLERARLLSDPLLPPRGRRASDPNRVAGQDAGGSRRDGDRAHRVSALPGWRRIRAPVPQSTVAGRAA